MNLDNSLWHCFNSPIFSTPGGSLHLPASQLKENTNATAADIIAMALKKKFANTNVSKLPTESDSPRSPLSELNVPDCRSSPLKRQQMLVFKKTNAKIDDTVSKTGTSNAQDKAILSTWSLGKVTKLSGILQNCRESYKTIENLEKLSSSKLILFSCASGLIKHQNYGNRGNRGYSRIYWSLYMSINGFYVRLKSHNMLFLEIGWIVPCQFFSTSYIVIIETWPNFFWSKQRFWFMVLCCYPWIKSHNVKRAVYMLTRNIKTWHVVYCI